MEPRSVDDDELGFMAQYLGNQDLAAVKEHLLLVWRQLMAGWARGSVSNSQVSSRTVHCMLL